MLSAAPPPAACRAGSTPSAQASKGCPLPPPLGRRRPLREALGSKPRVQSWQTLEARSQMAPQSEGAAHRPWAARRTPLAAGGVSLSSSCHAALRRGAAGLWGTTPDPAWELTPWPQTADEMNALGYEDWLRVSWRPPTLAHLRPSEQYNSFGRTRPWAGDMFPPEKLKEALQVCQWGERAPRCL